jgi:hypothetical protein
MGIDIWLKRIWLTIGIIALLILIGTGAGLLYEFVTSHTHHTDVMAGPDARPRGPDSLITQDLSFDQPCQVGKTDLLYIGVRVKDLTSAIPSSDMRVMMYSKSIYSSRNMVNIIFTKRDGMGSYLLLDRKAFIKAADIPTPLDSLQYFNLYDIAYYDTDHDGRINENDSSQLFISDVTGQHLSPITQSGDIVSWHEKSTDRKQLYILIQQKPKGADALHEDWPERLYVFDIKSRSLSRFPAGEDIYDRVRKMLWEK